MIANQAANFAFLHIPKCAGLTIHGVFQDKDDFGGFFFGTRAHPLLGQYDGNHVPLGMLRDIFPCAFNHIMPLEKFAIIRDPRQRFVSALAQRLRMFTNYEPSKIRARDLERELANVMDCLSNSGPMLPRDFAHFMRQADFVEIDGLRVVENLFPIERTNALILEFSSRLGVDPPSTAHSNVTIWRGSTLYNALRSLSFIYRRVLPEEQIQKGRKFLHRALSVSDVPPTLKHVLESETVQRFIEHHYAQDFELRAEVLEQD